MEKYLWNSEKIAKVAKVLSYFDVTIDMVIESLESDNNILEYRENVISRSYTTANNAWCKSEDGSSEERRYLRERIIFAPKEENAKDLLLDIYEDADDSDDEEAKILVIKELAKIF